MFASDMNVKEYLKKILASQVSRSNNLWNLWLDQFSSKLRTFA